MFVWPGPTLSVLQLLEVHAGASTHVLWSGFAAATCQRAASRASQTRIQKAARSFPRWAPLPSSHGGGLAAAIKKLNRGRKANPPSSAPPFHALRSVPEPAASHRGGARRLRRPPGRAREHLGGLRGSLRSRLPQRRSGAERSGEERRRRLLPPPCLPPLPPPLQPCPELAGRGERGRGGLRLRLQPEETLAGGNGGGWMPGSPSTSRELGQSRPAGT